MVINHPSPATLAHPRDCPANFPQAAGAGNDGAGVRLRNEMLLQSGVLFIAEQRADVSCANRRLDKNHNSPYTNDL